MAQRAESPGLWQEFREFLTKGDIVTIAVGLILALYFQQIINALLQGVIFPIIAAVFGKEDLFQIGFDIGDARINIGQVLNAIISFAVVGFLLFLIVKAFNRMRRSPDQPTPETELSVLRDIREQLRATRP